MKKLLKQANNWFKKLLNKLVVKFRKKIERRKRIQEIHELHKSFSKQFGVSPTMVIELMHRADKAEKSYKSPSTPLPNNISYREFLTEQLIVGAKAVNSISKKLPNFYDPEIIDIHNENIKDKRLNRPTTNEILKMMEESDIKELRHQANRLRTLKSDQLDNDPYGSVTTKKNRR